MTRNNDYKTLKSTKCKFAKILCPRWIWESSSKKLTDDNKMNVSESKTIIDRLYSTFNKRQLSQPNDEEVLWEIKTRLSKPLPEIPKIEKKSRSNNHRVSNKKPLIPDLRNIFNLPYYWGEMDRYEAEAELKDTEDGTFLLRDSAQDEFMFSVSFNRFGRTIHARVEFVNGHYSFDLHYGMAPTIPKLLSNYQNTNENMLFHPLCSKPRNRRHTFTLQNLCRSVICSSLTYYEDIYELNIPNNLLKKMHFSHFKVPLLYSNYNSESIQTNTSSS